MFKKVTVLVAALVLCFFASVNAQVYNDYIYKFSRVLGLINMYYVDTVNQEKLVDEAIVKMLQELDPHSIYISKEEVREMEEPLQGSFDGIGVQFNIMNDTILVVSPISGGPSEKLGILAGDRIVEIDGINVAGIGIKNSDVMKYLRGEKGSQVMVRIYRRGVRELLEFTITRDKIPIYSMDAAYMVDDSIGYIKLNRFAATTMDEFREGLIKLKKQNMKHLILDLQDNAGGFMNMATELADEFLGTNKMIVYTQGDKSPKREYNATSKGGFEEGKLVILVDGGSASASEIVSGAIQDWDRGLIIGRRSFGKGLVQRPFDLPDGSKIRLTIARYYTPTGRLIQRPYEDGVEDYAMDMVNRYNRGELTNADSIHFPDSLKYKTLLNKRDVYGGGGIMPDIFIPLDTSMNSDYYYNLRRKGVMNRFVLNYIDKNRKKLGKEYPEFEQFHSNFEITDELLADFFKTAESMGVKMDSAGFERSKKVIKIQIKSIMAADMWTFSESFQVFNELNPAYNEAINALKNDELYNSKLLGKKDEEK